MKLTQKYLISVGTNIHADDYTLQYSAHNGYLEVVKFLVSEGADIHADADYALRYSASNKHLGVVEFLLSKSTTNPVC
ncbi:ankyrin containing protein [mine drainage metagenome]|uniref:Ankyrin containing protein n=1 Tax=mine drainage metagenome TaxID=410659 RepID=T1CGM7_9ZZZZ